MEYLIGLVLALAVAGLATGVGFDRDRSFAPTVLIVIASYYVLFALMGGGPGRTMMVEIFVASGFLLLGVLGFKTNLWLIAAAMAGHGVFDFIHHRFINNPGVPNWWPGFCLAFDVLFGGWLAALLVRRSHPSLTGTSPRHQNSPHARS